MELEELVIKPVVTNGKIVAVSEIGVKVDIKGRMGSITIPLRSVITNKKLEVGQLVKFYFSYMQVQ
ncbi:CBO2463/CBO2479 domain-containing protein [Liquorilactobacillus uvarum]|uniref:Uncharacterized protein n=1 Tax=Liquorilactobacillus uvarum DSM 19971 TaxID=1423812 RepID=A0A0R1Q712_9LACO|nr:CBO2463/CBO2479 domain-containing protein [Liquorilactobacillus uvarum]KRL38133.1 hypothetical protein FD20_GL002081 [Liquorilactobacillus uvarum DSM 19971]